MILRFLVNVTDLLKKLGFFAIVLLPCLALVIVAFAFYVACLGVAEIVKAVSTHFFCIKEKKLVYRSLFEDGKREKN